MCSEKWKTLVSLALCTILFLIGSLENHKKSKNYICFFQKKKKRTLPWASYLIVFFCDRYVESVIVLQGGRGTKRGGQPAVQS